VAPPNADSFDFHGNVTMNGPSAFGAHATALSGAATPAWHHQLVSRLAEFAVVFAGREPTLNPVVAAEIRTMLRETTALLRCVPVDRGAIARKTTRLVTASSAVRELAAPAGLISDLMSAESE
jgi:hypothetical protein